MKIENIRSEKQAGRAKVLATVTWEESDRPVQEVFFETEEKFEKSLSCNPHAFLVGCILPAMYHGERRVFLKEKICPELREGLNTVMSWIQHWFVPDHKLVEIEAEVQSNPRPAITPKRAGSFFSGGIDSLAILRDNHLKFPPGHPGYIQDGLIIFGQNVESDNRPEAFERAVHALSEVALDSGITLIPIYTNIRSLDETPEFFISQFHGAILGAVAHALANRLATVYISSSDEIPTLSLIGRQNFKPFGSHPLIDPNYSSSDVQIRHVGLTLSRLDKTKLVADWDAGLQNIKVCQPNWPSENCGQCEKCVRTMLALLALGALNKTTAFPQNDVSEDLVSNIDIKPPIVKNSYSVEDNYLELIPALMKVGRPDLVGAIEQLIERFHNPKIPLRTRIREFDQKHLNGTLTKLKQDIFS